MRLDLSRAYQLCTVIEGAGQITVGDQSWSIQAPDAFILPSDLSQVTLSGDMALMVAEER